MYAPTKTNEGDRVIYTTNPWHYILADTVEFKSPLSYGMPVNRNASSPPRTLSEKMMDWKVWLRVEHAQLQAHKKWVEGDAANTNEGVEDITHLNLNKPLTKVC